MNQAPEWTDLRAIASDRWITATLKGTETEVELVVLRHDADTGAAVSLVRFPPGLTRDTLGCYPAAEELAIIDGSLNFAGHVFGPGDYCFVAPRVLRTPMSSPDGLLVLAWFSGTPTWFTDESERVAGEVVRRVLSPGVLREPSADLPGRTAVEENVTPSDVARDVLDLAAGRWTFVEAGQEAPAGTGPFQPRTWN